MHQHSHSKHTGAVTTNSTWTYKIPSVTCVPSKFSVSLLRDSPLHLEVSGMQNNSPDERGVYPTTLALPFSSAVTAACLLLFALPHAQTLTQHTHTGTCLSKSLWRASPPPLLLSTIRCPARSTSSLHCKEWLQSACAHS